MNIACATDANYIIHCCVMLTSFFENNRKGHHSVFLLSEKLPEKALMQVKTLVESYKATFTYCPINPDILSECPIKSSDHLTIATYNRLFMADLIPASVEKILYLDCDIIIKGSLKKLWNIAIDDNHVIAAMDEMGCCLNDVHQRLNIPESSGYFNAGVLLVNLDCWRRNNMTARFMEYIRKNQSILLSHDQDVLNVFFHDKCTHFPLRWNVELIYYLYPTIKRFRFALNYRYALLHPAILHFTWRPKPWEERCRHPFRIDYFRYSQKVGEYLSLKERIKALWDKYYFCMILSLGIKKEKLYKKIL